MTERTEVHRAPHKQIFDVEVARAIVARAIVAHVAITVDYQPYVIPLACAPYGMELLLHGSTASRVFKTLASGAPACVTITHVDGLVLARSSFESSMHYQSLMALGRARLIDENEKRPALQALTDHLFPQRRAELRKSTENEIKATSIVAFPLTEISVKVSSGEPDDPESDLESDVWAGVVPLKISYGTPVAAKNLRPHIAVPSYINNWPTR
jgi:nitroimidazol reductase NimA-like FMN-containing flavoprotein (pyridoxamine 5'-phosphate oxidase superfamily)